MFHSLTKAQRRCERFAHLGRIGPIGLVLLELFFSTPGDAQIPENVPTLTTQEKTVIEGYFTAPGFAPLSSYEVQPDGSRGITKIRPTASHWVTENPAFSSNKEEILFLAYCSSDAIVIAHATGNTASLIHQDHSIVTRTRFIVDSVIKPNGEIARGSKISAIREGGLVLDKGNLLRLDVLNSTAFAPGNEYLLLLRKVRQGPQIEDYLADLQTIGIRNNHLDIDEGSLQNLLSGELVTDATDELVHLASLDKLCPRKN